MSEVTAVPQSHVLNDNPSFGFNPINDLVDTLGSILAGGGTALGTAAANVVGVKYIPMKFANSGPYPISLAVYAQFGPGSEAFPTQDWQAKAWYRIKPGETITVGITYSNVFHYLASDTHNNVWSGDYVHSFVDVDGLHWNNQRFCTETMPDNWLLKFSSFTVTLKAPPPPPTPNFPPNTNISQNAFLVQFTNHTSQTVKYFVNGGAGYTAYLRTQKSVTINVVVNAGIQPIVGIFQNSGERSDFTIAGGKKYQFIIQGGKIVNAYA